MPLYVSPTASAIQVQTNSAYEFRKIRHRFTQPLPSASSRAAGAGGIATGNNAAYESSTVPLPPPSSRAARGGGIETGTNAAYESSTVPLPPPRSTAGTDSPEPPHVYETVY